MRLDGIPPTLDRKRTVGSDAPMPEAPIEDVFGLVGTTLEGRFVVDRVVAEGGFGVVYHAQQAALERPIALKVLKTPKRFDENERKQFLAGFAAEAKTVARITHPSIVQVFDFGVSPMPSGVQAAWMALEWLTGETLEDALATRRGRGGRSPSDCLAVLRPVLSALALVHKEGVAHRDIKPANIMIVKTAVGPTPKLLDFGIAKLMSADEAPGTGHTRTRSNQIAFSPAYAAPEQITQGRSGPWTDVHGMGLVLTEMLTDAMAFEGEEVAVLFQQIVDRARPTPARRGVQIGPWEEVLQRALAVSSAERYRDAGELLGALEATLQAAEVAFRSMPAERVDGTPARSPQAETLAAMSTQLAPASPSEAPAKPPNTTTHSPTSQDEQLRPVSRSALVPWIGGGIAVVAGAIVLVVRATSPSQETPVIATPVASAASPAAPSASTAPMASASASPPAPSTVPSAPTPSSTAPVTPAPNASASASASVPERSPPNRHPPPRPGPAGSARPKDIVIE
jgi:serine/threonine protein kinase